MSDVFDVAIVGSGPAGAAAAIAAARVRPQARVLLLDRAVFPRDKSCGDGIAPQAVDVLDSLGLTGLLDDHSPVSRLHLGRPADEGPVVSGLMHRAARVVPREVLDDRLHTAAVASGATFEQRTVRRMRLVGARGAGHGGYVVLDEELAARTVVAADGAHSPLRRQLGVPANPPGRVALAIRGYAPVRADLAEEQRIVFGQGTGRGYAWSFPVGDGRANVGYGEVLDGADGPTRAHLLDRLEELLPGCTADAVAWRAHHLPLSSWRPRPAHGPVLLAGDAASLINPVTGEGIYYALLSGACAGAAAVGPQGSAASRYTAMLRARLGRHLRHTSAVAGLTDLPGVLDAGLRASARSGPVFDDLVELGLGRGLLTGRVLGATARAWVPAAGRAARGSLEAAHLVRPVGLGEPS